MRQIISKAVLLLFLFPLALSIASCKSEASKARDAAIAKTQVLIGKWAKQSRSTSFTIEDRKRFADEMTAMLAENDKAGLTKQNLNEEQLATLKSLYRRATEVTKAMIAAKQSDYFTHLGGNWAGDDTIDEGIYNLRFDIK